MRRRVVLRSVAALAVSLIAGACLSPTLPLPPPDEPTTIRPSDEHPGTWEISGDCISGALVTLFNERTRKGVIAEDTDRDGRYRAEIEAELCDLILISQTVVTEEGEEDSAPSSFVLEARESGTTVGDVCP